MKQLFVLGLILTPLLFGCSKKTISKLQPAAAEPDTSIVTSDEDDVLTGRDSFLVAGFDKTACFGTCPVYQVRFYSNGRVTWYGRRYVERMGWYQAVCEASLLKRIRGKALEAGFLDFDHRYPPKPQVSDLPSTITYVRIGDIEKQVQHIYEGPEKLIAFEQFLQELIESLDWQPSSDR